MIFDFGFLLKCVIFVNKLLYTDPKLVLTKTRAHFVHRICNLRGHEQRLMTRTQHIPFKVLITRYIFTLQIKGGGGGFRIILENKVHDRVVCSACTATGVANQNCGFEIASVTRHDNREHRAMIPTAHGTDHISGPPDYLRQPVRVFFNIR